MGQPETVVRTASAGELDRLVSTLGQRPYFVDRLARQDRGEGVVLVAWSYGHPVGDVYLWRAPANEPQIRMHLPGVPMLNHLEVRPDHRGRGIGTVIVDHAEQVASQLGYQRVALGVGIDNPRAHRLYRRLGYVDWGHGRVETSYATSAPDGSVRRFAETIHILLKTVVLG